MTALALIAVAGCGSDGAGNAKLSSFQDCVDARHFFVLTRQGPDTRVLVTIRDRARGTVVGEVATGKHATLGGAAAKNGRYLMSTATPLGRDAAAIENCWDHFFPVAR
jgi:hypothetical protein